MVTLARILLLKFETVTDSRTDLLSCREFFDNCFGGFCALVGLALSAVGIVLYLMASSPTSWTMAIAVPAVGGVLMSLFRLALGGNWLAPILKAMFTIPALLALAYWDLPFWADFLLSAHVIGMVIAAPIAASSILGDVADAAVGVMTWMMLLLSLAIYTMKFLFEWVYIAALVVVIALFVLGSILSLLGVMMAPRRGTDAWQIGWTGLIVSVAGIALALSGYTIKDALVLLPPW